MSGSGRATWIGLVAASAVALTGCSSTPPSPSPSSAPSSTSAPSTPSAPGSTGPSPGGSASNSPASASAGATVPLSVDVTLRRPPVWGLPRTDGWSPVVLDQQGLNKLELTNGCTLTTVQSAGTIAPIDDGTGTGLTKAPTDATATKAFLEKGFKDTEKTLTDVRMLGALTALDIPVGTSTAGESGSGQRIEFAQLGYGYTDSATGAPWRSLVTARLMPTPAATLVATLSCPAAEFESAVGVLDGLRVITT